MALSTSVGFPIGMEVLKLQQQDAAATHGQSVACSGAALTADTGNSVALGSGSPGVTPRTITVGAAATEAALFMESGAIGITTWKFGTWAVRVNVQTANALVEIDSIYICRVNSAGVSQGTVASRTGIGRPISDTGVETIYLFQENDVTAAATDRIYIVFVFENTDVGAQDIAITPDQMISTPVRLVQHIVARRQRLSSNGKRLTAIVRAYAITPAIDTPVEVAAPCAIVRVYAPPQIGISGTRDFEIP